MDPTRWILRDGSYEMDPTKLILQDGSNETHNDLTTPDPTTTDLMTIYVNDSTTCMQLADLSSSF